MKKWLKDMTPAMLLYMAVIALVALGNGFSDSILANYFKDAYHVDAVQRGFIEFPREMPGFLCAIAIAALSALGDIRASMVAQILGVIGLTVLGLFTPAFGVMLIFLFLYSSGIHLFVPLSDSIGMSLAEPDRIGKRMGQYNAIKQAVGFVAAIVVFFGFRLGWFSFSAPVKLPFLIAAVCFALALAALVLLNRRAGATQPVHRRKFRLVFRREYKYYYMLTVVRGVQKQIAFVYGTWVIVDLLSKGADVTAMLAIVSSFICIFFMTALGKWMDRFGIKKMMYVDALTFISVYVLYGLVVMGINAGRLPSVGWPVLMVYVLFILDRMSMQIGMVNAIYLRSIALDEDEVTATLSTGVSLEHIVSILAATAGGFVWQYWGSQWVFFIAAFLSLANIAVAWRVKPEQERAHALEVRAQRQGNVNA